MDLSSFHNQFREETSENLRILSDGLLALEQSAGLEDPTAREQLDRVFRAMHTIKGSARMLGFKTIGRLAHAMEHALSAVREGQRQLSRSLADSLLLGGDAILELTAANPDDHPASIDVDGLIHNLGWSGQEAPEIASAQIESAGESSHQDNTPQQASESDIKSTHILSKLSARPNNRQTVRVRVDRLDRLINLTGELVVGHQVLTSHLNTLQMLRSLLQQQENMTRALDSELQLLRFSASQRQSLDHNIGQLVDKGAQTIWLLEQQLERITAHTYQQSFLLGDLEQEVMASRLLPIATVFTHLPRAVRDLTQATGKEVDLEVHGEATEVDRKVLETLSDPLLHLVRNAVDHGIEPPDERVAHSKPRTGQIRVWAEANGGEVRVCISDDGRGMNPQKLRNSAVSKGLVSAEEVALLSDQEALELIFLPGFTTTQLITDISGRGVGMDVVRSSISDLGGSILIGSAPGRGTQITLLLPLTLVTTRVVLIRSAAQIFALPASGCRGIAWIYPDQIRTIEGHATVEHEGRTLPLVQMAGLLGVERTSLFQNGRRAPAVILGSGQRSWGLLIDQLLDEREAVVKPLGPLFEAQRHYSGAIQLGDGNLILLLNPMALAQIVRGLTLHEPNVVASAASRTYHLLVTDDSFTTRELIRSILQSAGYRVTVAVDGLDALEKLRTESFDLVVSDVEMPRINGFELTTRIRQELGLNELPVIIMTSLASDAHRRQGLEAGAQAYIIKSQFDQDNLLGAIQQLLGSDLVRHS
jgi:two-component system chemotaxis sensor kinase CheA